MTTSPDAVAALERAHALHAAGRVDDALATVRLALEIDPDYVNALTYYGTTLITRRLAYPEGLAALEHAAAVAPDDAGVQYSLGWCEEFVAYRLEKLASRAYRDPIQLYEQATRHLQACIDLDPEPGLKDDAQQLLDSVLDRL